jgi:hypothetical protein
MRLLGLASFALAALAAFINAEPGRFSGQADALALAAAIPVALTALIQQLLNRVTSSLMPALIALTFAVAGGAAIAGVFLAFAPANLSYIGSTAALGISLLAATAAFLTGSFGWIGWRPRLGRRRLHPFVARAEVRKWQLRDRALAAAIFALCSLASIAIGYASWANRAIVEIGKSLVFHKG